MSLEKFRPPGMVIVEKLTGEVVVDVSKGPFGNEKIPHKLTTEQLLMLEHFFGEVPANIIALGDPKPPILPLDPEKLLENT